MHVVDGEIKAQFVEAGMMDNCPEDPFVVSDADTMLQHLS
jgi:peroxiredoxin